MDKRQLWYGIVAAQFVLGNQHTPDATASGWVNALHLLESQTCHMYHHVAVVMLVLWCCGNVGAVVMFILMPKPLLSRGNAAQHNTVTNHTQQSPLLICPTPYAHNQLVLRQ